MHTQQLLPGWSLTVLLMHRMLLVMHFNMSAGGLALCRGELEDSPRCHTSSALSPPNECLIAAGQAKVHDSY